MDTVYISGHPVRLQSDRAIGKGGEADIFKLDAATVLKLYKQPKDPDYSNDLSAQQGAKLRITEQQKKLPAFPKNLPVEVVAPMDVALSKSGIIVGYTMPYAANMEVLMRLGDRQYRETGGIDGNKVIDTFRTLHSVVDAIHSQGVVIGDFNDLNVLVDDSQLRIVDADSMQFGTFLCHTFTNRFLDPLVSDLSTLVPIRPHNDASDWYAYFIMLLQSLLYVGPYGGVHRPKTGKRLQHDSRVLRRLTVLDSDVIYPKPAMSLTTMPDELLAYMEQVFKQDRREPFPPQLFDTLRFTTCNTCGLTHARSICPGCAAPGVTVQKITVRGTVTARSVFKTKGRLLHTVVQSKKLRYLYYENGGFYRENGRKLLEGDLDPELRFRIQGDKTLIGKRDALFVSEPSGESRRINIDMYRDTLPMFDANADHAVWLYGGQLLRDGHVGAEYIGGVLPGQTLFWAGESRGFGMYQAGAMTRAFTFAPSTRGMNDQVPVMPVTGQLVDASCVFSDTHTWFMTTSQKKGKLVHDCSVIDAQGNVVTTLSAVKGDGTWLSHGIRGHLAAQASLFAATDDGIVRVGCGNGAISVEREFPDTEPFVSSHVQLVQGPGGIYVVSSTEITLLEIR